MGASLKSMQFLCRTLPYLTMHALPASFDSIIDNIPHLLTTSCTGHLHHTRIH